VDWDEALLSGSSRKHPHFITKIVLVSQKKNKDICISAYDVDLLVTSLRVASLAWRTILVSASS